MKRKFILFGYFSAFLVTLIWGASPVMIRMLLNPEGINIAAIPFLSALSDAPPVDPLVLNGLRSLIGSLFLCFLFVIIHPKKINQFKHLPKDKLFLISVIALTIGNFLYHLSFKYTLATDVTLIANYSPVVVLILYLIYSLRTRDIAFSKLPALRNIVLTVLVGCLGTSIVIINDPFESISENRLKFIGDNIQFVGVLFWSLFLFTSHRYAKINAHISSFPITITTLLLSSIILLIFGFIFTFDAFFGMNAVQWYCILFLSIFTTGICYLLWYKASKSIGVLSMVLFLNLTSVIAALVESLVYGNIISYKLIVGAAMIIGASIYAEMLNKQFEKKGV